MRARALAGLALASVLAVGVTRQVTTGARAMQTSDEALAVGDRMGAVLGARVAAEALLPGSPYPRRGMERLAHLARDAEARGDLALAGAAYRAMRAAVAETRAAVGDHAAWREEARAGLARVGAKEDADGADPSARLPPPTLAASDPGPSPAELLLVAALPFALYAGGARLLRRARRDRAR